MHDVSLLAWRLRLQLAAGLSNARDSETRKQEAT
jgi:hypothetical protein